MFNIISDLYYGDIHPNVKTYPEGSEAAKLFQIHAENEEWLTEHLEGEAKKKLFNLLNSQNELEGLLSYENFHRGFLLGARLIMEICCFSDKEDAA